MPNATPTEKTNPLEEMFDRPIVAPDTDDGIGPTLGEDLSPEHERAEDARYRRPAPTDGAPRESRSFAAADGNVLRNGRSA